MSQLSCQSREQLIQRIQTNLNTGRQQAGLAPIAVDGKWGPQTAEAMRLAQIALGMPCNFSVADSTAAFEDFYAQHRELCEQFGREPRQFQPARPNYNLVNQCAAPGTQPGFSQGRPPIIHDPRPPSHIPAWQDLPPARPGRDPGNWITPPGRW